MWKHVESIQLFGEEKSYTLYNWPWMEKRFSFLFWEHLKNVLSDLFEKRFVWFIAYVFIFLQYERGNLTSIAAYIVMFLSVVNLAKEVGQLIKLVRLAMRGTWLRQPAWYKTWLVLTRVTTPVTSYATQTCRNGACAHYVMVSKFQWKPFWLATQRDPQIHMTGLPPKIVWTMMYSHRPHSSFLLLSFLLEIIFLVFWFAVLIWRNPGACKLP